MGTGTALLLTFVFGLVFFYVLFFVVRAAVEQGVRRALPDAKLRVQQAPPYAGSAPGPDGEQV